jgi:hypothetical protein
VSSTRFSEAEALLLAGNDQGPAADRPVWALELLVGDLDAATVYRERDNVDLLIEIGSLKLTVVIENKIGARASEGQLARCRRRNLAERRGRNRYGPSSQTV